MNIMIAPNDFVFLMTRRNLKKRMKDLKGAFIDLNEANILAPNSNCVLTKRWEYKSYWVTMKELLMIYTMQMMHIPCKLRS